MSSVGALLMIILFGSSFLASRILALPTLSNDQDAVIRFYTDSGNIVEIENRAYENPQTSNSMNMANNNEMTLFPMERNGMPATVPAGNMAPSLPGELSAGSPRSVLMDINGQARPYNAHKVVTRGGQHYCGESLVSAMALICHGNYKKRNQAHGTSEELDYPFHGKNGDQLSTVDRPSWEEVLQILKNVGTLYRPAPLSQSSSSSNSGGPFVVYLQSAYPNRANDLSKVRFKRGVVDECCKNPCSSYQMSKYCNYKNASTNSDNERSKSKES